MEHLDYSALGSLKEVMEDDFLLLIETFLQDAEGRVKSLASYISTPPDADTLRRTAHSFKGSCSNIGAPLLTSYCAALEKKAVEQGVVDIDLDINQIVAEYAEVKRLLIDYSK